jgi:hypothetical protein
MPLSTQAQQIAARLMYDIQRDFNLPAHAAAAIVGNLAHESGGFSQFQEIDPLVPGSRGGFGYAQWTGPRRVQFENWAAQAGHPLTSYEANYGFLKHELSDPNWATFLNNLQNTSSVDGASGLVMNEFLRPAQFARIASANDRAANSREALGLPAFQPTSGIPFEGPLAGAGFGALPGGAGLDGIPGSMPHSRPTARLSRVIFSRGLTRTVSGASFLRRPQHSRLSARFSPARSRRDCCRVSIRTAWAALPFRPPRLSTPTLLAGLPVSRQPRLTRTALAVLLSPLLHRLIPIA